MMHDPMHPSEPDQLRSAQRDAEPRPGREHPAGHGRWLGKEDAGVWRVEYQDDDGGCYVAIFAGPAAEQRAQDYFQALQTGRLRTIRGAPSH